MSDKIREEFEAAWKTARVNERYIESVIQVDLDSFNHVLNEYGYRDIQEAWYFWQVSRAALVVELPADNDYQTYYAYEVKESLNRAGVKYK